MGETITDIEQLYSCEHIKDITELSDNMLSIDLKHSRDIQIELEKWYVSNINNYHHTTFHLKKR